jgi:mannan endo-1,4-beta-mannosidase
MKSTKMKKMFSLIMSLVLTTSISSTNVFKVKAETTPTVIYSNDFEDAAKLPAGKTSADLVDINGSKAVSYDVTFDSTSGWSESGMVDITYEYTNPITSGAKLQMDVFLPANSTYTGTIKFQGITKLGSDWSWTQSNTIPEFSAADFTTENGFMKKTIEIPFGDEIAAKTGLHQILIKLVGYQCNYTGKLYVDNLKLIDGGASAPEKTVYYNNDLEDTSKLPELSEKIAGASLVNDVNGSKALGINYVFDKNNGWDQADMQFTTEYTDPIAAGAQLSVDLILPKDATYNGKISLKGAVKMGSGWTWTEADSMQDVDLSKFTIAGNYKTQTITFTFGGQISANQGLHAVCLQIVGNNCDYNGMYYLDNVNFVEGDTQGYMDKYVTITAKPIAQTKVEPNILSIPNSVSLVDAMASTQTTQLYAYLLGVGKSDYLIYGHQNDTIHKAGPAAGTKDGDFTFTNSDTKDLTGSYSGVEGIDSISLTGADYSVPAGSNDDLITYTAKLMAKAASEGSIIILTSHMPNFAEVVAKGKDSKGQYDYSGYSTDHTSGDIVQRVMPGGDLNEAFLGYMDMVADFGNQMEEKGIPVVYRPFHENTGSWFWWGAAQCDPAAFKNLWRYTVEYLRDIKGVHNFIYEYSPGSNFNNENEYLERYPGDDYVDILAFDMYNNDPTLTDGFPDTLADTVRIIDGLAVKHNKPTAVAETGIAATGENGMAVSGNERLNWHQDVSNALSMTNAAYFMTWVNFGEGSGLYQPYLKTATTGHEMSNYFIDYYNDETSVFADGMGNYSTINVTNTKATNNITGYMVTPYSGYRMLEGSTLKAIVKNADQEVDFVLKDSNGNILTTLKADGTGSEYTANVTDELLKTITPTYGSIELSIGGVVYDKINIMFNMKEEVEDPAVIDTFESYNGNDALMGLKWATNAGSGCSVTPKTSPQVDLHNNGNYGLAFNYKISTEKASEGWAGVTKAWTADWSSYDALQIWVKPDGNAQKLVIQITSNGEDFEVWLPDFAATTEAKLLTLPFTQFVGKNKGTFDPSKISKFGIWCNTIVPEGHTGPWTVDSTMYFDDIKVVNTKAVSITSIDNITESVEQGQAFALPSKVSANYSDGTKKEVDVAWIPPSVDTSNAGTFTFKGSVDGYEKQVTLTLTVNAKPVIITGIDDVTAIVTEDDSYTLPSKVSASYSDGTRNDVDVTWNPASVDTSNAGTFTFKGSVDGYEKQITLTLTVIAKPAATEKNETAKLPKTGAVIDGSVLINVGAFLVVAGTLFLVFSRRRQNIK